MYILSVGLQDIYLIILLLFQANNLVFISNFVFWHGWDWWNLEYSRMSACMHAKSLQSYLTLCNPMDYSPPGTSVHGILQVRILEWMSCPPGDLPKPGIEPRSPALQADSLPAEPPGKPKNTGVGSLSLLQGIFQTQELNWGLLHCRWILYQLSYQGSSRYLLLLLLLSHFSRVRFCATP